MDQVLAIVRGRLRIGGRNRGVYLLRTLGVAVAGVVIAWFIIDPLLAAGRGRGALQAQAGSAFFTFAFIQQLVLIIAAGRLGASTLSRERESNTLPLLLASGMSLRRIVFALALARWLPLALGLAAGLPLALLLLLLGGVTPRSALVAYAITFGALTLSLGVGCLFSSVMARTRAAIAATGATMLTLCLVLPVAVEVFAFSFPRLRLLNWFSPFTTLLDADRVAPGSLLRRAATWGLTGLLLVLLGGQLAKQTVGRGVVSAGPRHVLRRPVRSFGRWPLVTLEIARGRTVLFWIGIAVGPCIVFGLTGLGFVHVSLATGPLISLAGLAAIFAWFSALFTAARAFAEDRRTGTLANLVVTPVPGRVILRSKVAGLLFQLLPYALFQVAAIGVALLLGLLGGETLLGDFYVGGFVWIAVSWVTIVMITYVGLFCSLATPAEGPATLLTFLVATLFWLLFGCAIGYLEYAGLIVPIFAAGLAAIFVEHDFDRLVQRTE